MGFKITHVIFYILLMKYIKGCSISYDERVGHRNCILNCIDYVSDPGFFSHPYQRNKCVDVMDNFYISELSYKLNIFQPSSIPLLKNRYNSGVNILDAVNSLNLCDNHFTVTPSITSMSKLKLINISRNNLTTAILSNNQELRMLTEVDFSYNFITNIQVIEYQYVYHKLTKINLSHNQLVKIPESIFDQFRNLQILDLSFNFIEILSAVTFEGMRKLAELNLSNNRLTSIKSSLFRFNELNFLNLSGNRIANLEPNDFNQLFKLRTLDLSSNILKVVNIDTFKNTIMLEKIDLSNNLLQIIEPETFSSLQALSDIDLSNNQLKSLPTNLFNHTNIFSFSITDNQLEGSIIKGMFDGINVTKLDFSYQFLTEVKDYAFENLDKLNYLFLNSNNITFLSTKCFKTLINLKQLDLSNNQIKTIDFDKNDLTNLQFLMLKNNRIVNIKYEELESLTSLKFLDISENQITHFTSNQFHKLKNLINLDIHDNPFVGTMESGTFEGLILLPSLDMSHSLLTSINNASFANMHSLKELNITNCQISELQYNIFIHTGAIEVLDLSYNKLTEFFVNATELSTLSTLFLNNNLIKIISATSINNMFRLKKLILSHNIIENIPSEVYLTHLQQLDLSYNEKLNCTISMLRESNSVSTLILSGIKTVINFKYITNNSNIGDLIISNANISKISQLSVNKMVNLLQMDLSYNNVSKLQVGDFNELKSLSRLDLAFNKISFIQPGLFKDNEFLEYLNISHNYISSISYGIFRGLNSLKILDMSFNKIKDLQSEKFYETKHLTELIVDFNQIDSINTQEFAGTRLSKLSIGNNPIDCKMLVQLNKIKVPFEITALGLDEHSNENVNGIICNKKRTTKLTLLPVNNSNDNASYSIFETLRNILEHFNDKRKEQETIDNKYLEKISNSLDNLSQVLIINNNTNIMLSKLIKSLEQTTAKAPILMTSTSPATTITHRTSYTPTKYISDDTQTTDIISYINHIKKELENTIAFEKQNIVNKIESKFAVSGNQTEFLATNINYRQLVSSNNEVSTSLFTETYVALILSVSLVCVLVGLLFYKFYKSRLRSTFSISNHVLPGAMDNSTL